MDVLTIAAQAQINGEITGAAYKWRKLAAEVLSLPARVLDRGHDLLAFLRKD